MREHMNPYYQMIEGPKLIGSIVAYLFNVLILVCCAPYMALPKGQFPLGAYSILVPICIVILPLASTGALLGGSILRIKVCFSISVLANLVLGALTILSPHVVLAAFTTDTDRPPIRCSARGPVRERETR